MTKCQVFARELKEYAELSNDGWGEKCMALIRLAEIPGSCSNIFYEALENEIETELDAIKCQYKIVERSETVVVKNKTLEWL